MAKIIRGALPSAAIKAQYQKAMVKMIDEMHRSTLYWIKAGYNAREDEIVSKDASPAAELEKALKRLYRRWSDKFSIFAAVRAKWFAKRANTTTTQQLYNSMQDAGLLVNVKNSRRISGILNSIVFENVNLIKTIPEQYFGQVHTIVMQGMQNGRNTGYVAEQLEKRYSVTRSRAIIIARDQTNKATEFLAVARCAEWGVTEGVWMHRSGSKVSRPTHEAMDGKRFKLSEGLYDSNKYVRRKVVPGELINCNCTFRPVIPELEGAA